MLLVPLPISKGGDYVPALLSDDRGQGMVEYGMIVALITVLLIVSLLAFRGGMLGVLSRINDCFLKSQQRSTC